MFARNRNIKIKCKLDGKINLLPHCIDCGFKNFNAGKTQFILLDWSYNTDVIDVKMRLSVLE